MANRAIGIRPTQSGVGALSLRWPFADPNYKVLTFDLQSL